MRCLQCDQKLPIYLKIVGSHFCSGAHKKAYNRDGARLVVEAFQQTELLIRSAAVSALENEFMSREQVGDELLVQ